MKTKLLIMLAIFTFLFAHSLKAIETQIFYDNFESDIENWNLQSGWSVILENDLLLGLKSQVSRRSS